MKSITLRRRADNVRSIDASSVRLDRLMEMSADQIARQSVPALSVEVELGDLFEIDCRETDTGQPILIFQGDCGGVHRVGQQHRVGQIIVEGNVGDYCGACMSGGTIDVAGNAGAYVGAPTGSRGVGMNGGRIMVSGSVGDFAGNRMRRGEIWVAGDAGSGLASWQVAGTIGVGGVIGDHVGYGMRRGTLVLATPTRLPAARFTSPVELQTPFYALLLKRPEMATSWPPAECQSDSLKWYTSRGDRSIGGIGEVWYPISRGTAS
ncbi:formylmethanofuran dehydrogenase subunit C [Allorhodopirellula heiligendammensis]|uniref:Formyltransferase/hydrolase complex Fhc subunit C n=1 Tax=Allorhodopirellula heiligendammensis TaxID=2714739 RepID=A0A5C6BSA5_9BACT|nr:formylmethanofuran dehydrogenase subunit C [Allorhodopirellula heiligendammensis]TWU15120.1 Formyltransferase/hydrolase complex Fhc subunit C [Allorhodopirellula heiligendammensis]